jgi:hypothetical protein
MDCCILALAFLYHCAKSHSRINITIKCTSCPTECLQYICWKMQCLYLPQLHLVLCHHQKILCSCWCPILFWWVCACYLYYLLIDLTPSCIACMYCACYTHRLIWHQAAMFVRTCVDVMNACRKALRKVHDIWNCGPAFLCILLQPSRAWCNQSVSSFFDLPYGFVTGRRYHTSWAFLFVFFLLFLHCLFLGIMFCRFTSFHPGLVGDPRSGPFLNLSSSCHKMPSR